MYALLYHVWMIIAIGGGLSPYNTVPDHTVAAGEPGGRRASYIDTDHHRRQWRLHIYTSV